MNTKSYLLIAGVLVVIAGLFAVRGLQTTAEVDGDDRRGSTELAEGGADSTERSDSRGARIGSINASSDGGARQQGRGQRITRRSPGAAALEVTPATRSASDAAPVEDSSSDIDENLSPEERRSIADLTNMFRSETDPERRAEIAEELGQIDSRESVKNMLDLLRGEDDESVQQAILEALEGLDGLEDMADEVYRTVSEIYMKTTSEDVKVAAQSLMGDLGTQAAADGLRQVVMTGDGVDRVKAHAAETLLRIGQGEQDIVPPAEVNAISQQLRETYMNTEDARERQYLIMAMAMDRNNIEFMQQALQTEQDPNNRQTLERLVAIYTAPPPEAPPSGTIVTPVPTLVPTAPPGAPPTTLPGAPPGGFPTTPPSPPGT